MGENSQLILTVWVGWEITQLTFIPIKCHLIVKIVTHTQLIYAISFTHELIVARMLQWELALQHQKINKKTKIRYTRWLYEEMYKQKATCRGLKDRTRHMQVHQIQETPTHPIAPNSNPPPWWMKDKKGIKSPKQNKGQAKWDKEENTSWKQESS